MMITISGSNQLLIEGEKCIRSAEDVLKYYPEIKLEETKKKEIFIASDLREVYGVLDVKGKTIDEICRCLKSTVNLILPKLTLLEMQGLVIQYPGKIFVKAK